MTTLITGATGFVGAAVARQILSEGRPVRVLVREESDRRNIAGLNVDIVVGDITDRQSLDHAMKGCEALFHVAADYRIWCPDPATMHRTNVEGTREIMLAAAEAGVRRIVYTSSVAALGAGSDDAPADEETPTGPEQMTGTYKLTKFLAEQEVSRLVREQGLPAIIVNPSTPIGPRDIKPTPTGRIIVDAVAGRMPAFVDTGLNVVHVDDVAAGHLLAFSRGQVGRRYILGGENLSLQQILTLVAHYSGRRPPRFRLPHKAVMPVAYIAEAFGRLTKREPFVTLDAVRMARKRMYYSSDRARGELGYSPRPANDALRDAIAWFQDHGYC